MGAKTAMAVALKEPSLCGDVVAVDNAPIDAALGSQFTVYLDGMKAVDAKQCASSKEADQVLRAFVEVRASVSLPTGRLCAVDRFGLCEGSD